MRFTSGKWRATVANFLMARGHLLLLTIVVALALFTRLYGIDWDQGGLYHPDERAILFRVTDLGFPINQLESLFTAESVLNPKWFPYGSLPLYLLKLTGFLAPPWLENPTLEKLAIMGRAISALFDVATVVLVYAIGSRLFGRVAGLLGSSFIALSVLHIQQSHFFVTDIMLVALMMASFSFLTRAMETGRTRTFLWAGLFYGLAVATKFTAAPFALVFVVAACLYVGKDRPDPAERRVRVGQMLRRLACAGAVTILTYGIAQPYGLIDWTTYWGDVGKQSEMVRRVVDFPFTRQYVETTAYFYHVKQLAVWGMGIPLGVLVWLGILFSAGMAVVRRDRRHIMLASWVIPYFAITGAFDVKFMRYLLPMTPFAAIMAAHMVVWLVGWLRTLKWRSAYCAVMHTCIATVLLLTLFYALAYVNIYTRPHPAEAASDWINTHVPQGSVLLQDSGWEEGFKRLGGYRQIRMEVYDDESVNKRARMIEGLARADYLLFYSNRQYGTIPRLPDRYPMTSAYYQKLFGGELGYELAHWETAFPNLYGVSLKDDTLTRPALPSPAVFKHYEQTAVELNLGYADESFTVYDHPTVLIFRKTLDGSERQQREFFEAQLPPPGGNLISTNRLLLSDGELERQRSGGTWSELFSRRSIINKAPALFWILMVQLAFLVTLPLTMLLFRRLPDRGYLLGKTLAVLLAAYIPWLLASLQWVSFSRASVGTGLLVLAMASAVVLGFKAREMVGFLRQQRRLVVLGELVFLLSFFGFYGIRLWNPDLWQQDQWVWWIEQFGRGGEKPMDFAYFNAVVRSSTMPPYDPWFSGGYLNYYYYGHFMAASLTKFLGVIPSKAMPLIVPTFFALTTTAAFSVTYNLASSVRTRFAKGARSSWDKIPSPYLVGLLGAAFVVVLGNLDGVWQLAEGVGRVVSAEPFGIFDFWRSSRMMPNDLEGVTEFPYFTFLFGDPHAHLFVLPLTLLAIALALVIVLGRGTKIPIIGRLSLFPFFALALTLGAILATNSWDVVTYGLIGSVALFIPDLVRRRKLDLAFVGRNLVKVALLGALSLLLFWPYYSAYEVPIPAPSSTGFIAKIPIVGNVQQAISGTFNRSAYVTDLWRYIGINGVFISILVTLLVYETWSRFGKSLRKSFLRSNRLRCPACAYGWGCYAVLALSLLTLLFMAGFATIGFLLGLLLLLAPVALSEIRHPKLRTPALLMVYVLIAVALSLGIFVDLFTFANDIGRLNTVFKFYLQAWVLLSIASAFALWRLRFGWVIRCRSVRLMWQCCIVALVVAGLIYPVLATPVRSKARFELIPPTVDGMTYMNTAIYREQETAIELVWDRYGIEWLQDNVEGSPVIVEGLTPLYRWGGRVSVYTGLPAVIGWDHHQKQQRGDYVGRPSGVDQRRRDVDRLYNTLVIDEAQSIIDRYDVRYIYVGALERLYYHRGGLAKFDSFPDGRLRLAYQNPEVRIYEVHSGS